MKSPARYPTKVRPRYPRSRSGCLPCRQRRKKCDETKPACSTCQRKRLDCRWPAQKDDPTPQSQYRTIAPTGRRAEASADVELSLQLIVAGQARASGLTPESTHLLRYYITETAGQLQTGSSSRNPFVRCVLPAAQTDEVLMHAVLAVGGAHLAYNMPGNDKIDIAARRHYSRAVQGVRDEIAVRALSKESLVRLSLILAFLCRHEVLVGAAQSALRCHLNAMQQIFSCLEASGYRPFDSQTSGDMDELVALAYELKTYLLQCNQTLALPGLEAESPELGGETGSNVRMTKFKGSSTFGTVYAGCEGLFSLIPKIHRLYGRRLSEEAAGLMQPSPGLQSCFDQIHHQIESWRLDTTHSSPPRGSSQPANAASAPGNMDTRGNSTKDLGEYRDHRQKSIASECIRLALRIYALVSIQGSSAGLLASSSQGRGTIQAHSNAVLDLAISLGDTSYHSHLLWAILVAGSCMVDTSYRQILKSALTGTHYQMRHVHIVRDVLSLVWADEDPMVYGPYGVQVVVAKYGINLNLI